ncbi:MAG: hypothetical protein AAGA20_21965 [Planctomycetota bacterium]
MVRPALSAALALVASCAGGGADEGDTRPLETRASADVFVEGTERYSDGAWRKHGSFVFRDERGSVLAAGAYVDGLESGPWEETYDDGSTGRGAYRDGQRSGAWETFHSSGSSQDRGRYENGLRSGTWISRRDDGSLLREAEYARGALDGRVVWYGPDGRTIDVERSGVYRDGERRAPLSSAARR